jgi:DNA (cytosine-5)-methyltransferase 1
MKPGKGGVNGLNQWFFNTKKLHFDKPSNSVNKEHIGTRAGLVHPSEDRLLGTGEYQRVHSYPDPFEIKGNYGDVVNRIGNSVPPLLMKAIAAQICHELWNGEPLSRYPKTMTYPEILEAAWQDHLAPRDPDAPTVISTFAGGGGSSLGYSMAGYRELLAVEWDDNAVETFKLNFPDVPVYHGDITKLSVEECMKLAGLSGPGELDCLDGSPPCQGFSTAGKRILNDPRNQLFREYVRLLRGLKPKVFVMENVPGLVKGKMKLVFAEIMRELKASGYQVRCKKLNAMYFYVPQSRERLIFIGVRNDLGVGASHPGAESRPVTVGEALEGIESLDGPLPARNTKLSECCNNMQQGTTASQFYRKNWGFNLHRLSWDKVAPTFTRGEGACGLIHPILPRKCVKQEYQAVMSFPRQVTFFGKEDQARERISNSVPPLLMRSIAEHIKINILTIAEPELIT